MQADKGLHCMKLSPKIWLFVLAMAAFHLWPFALYHIEGDAKGHFFNLECFGRAIMEGVFYPRWCSYGNDSIGSPAMFFYFPFPYIVSLPFYPLTLHFINTEQLLVSQLFVLNVVTLIGCLLWFRQHISLRASVVLALLYFWFPYRSEALFFRVALAELWVLALFPWLMWAIDKLKANPHFWPVTALLLACCILSHISCTIVVLVVLTVLIFVQVIAKECIVPLLKAGLLAIALTSVYWVPLFVYHPFVMGNAEFDLMTTFPNRQPLMIDFEREARSRVLLNNALTLFFIVLLSIYLVTRKEVVRVLEWKRSLIAVFLLLAVGLFVVLPPLSAPIWSWLNGQAGIIGTMSQMIMPWRFQALLLFSSMILALVFIQAIQRNIIHRPTLKMDVSALYVMVFFQCMMTYTSFLNVAPFQNYDEFLKRAVLPLREYLTIWQHEGYRYDDLIKEINSPDPNPHRIIQGKGEILKYQQSQDQIVVTVDAKTPLTMRLRYLYFPTWHVDAPDSKIMLEPSAKTGLMQLSVPKGLHTIVLKHRAYESAKYPLLAYLPYICILLWGAILFFVGSQFCKSLKKSAVR
jgi:hypothetical protein